MRPAAQTSRGVLLPGEVAQELPGGRRILRRARDRVPDEVPVPSATVERVATGLSRERAVAVRRRVEKGEHALTM